MGYVRRVRVGIPVPYARSERPLYPRFRVYLPVYGGYMSVGRRRRAAGDDLWRRCQYGDCPQDIKDKYTHNTVADNILKWGSSGVYLGGLGIGTGAAGGGVVPGTGGVTGTGVVPTWARPAGPDSVVPWGRPTPSEGVSSFIPRERPFQLPGADIPVTVDPATSSTPVRPGPDTPSNTFVNPVFDGDLVSVSSSDNVVIGDPVQLPDQTPVLEIPEGPVTRGDTFIYEHELGGSIDPDRLPFFPKLSEPPPGTAFETFELETLGPLDVTADTRDYAETGFPYTSTPDPSLVRPTRPTSARLPHGTTVTVHNPLYDPELHVEELFNEGLQRLLGDASLRDVDLGPVAYGRSGRRVTVSREGRVAAGIRLRSGRRLPLPVRFIAEVSSIGPADPLGIELRALVPDGASDTVVTDHRLAETSFTGDTTIPWDGGPLPTQTQSDVLFDAPFVDIDLQDPFPEMEIDDDGAPLLGGRSVTLDIGRSAIRSIGQPLGFVLPYPATIRPLPDIHRPGGSVPSAPVLPGVVVGYDDGVIDPSLYWWYLRRKRRRRRLFRFLYR